MPLALCFKVERLTESLDDDSTRQSYEAGKEGLTMPTLMSEMPSFFVRSTIFEGKGAYPDGTGEVQSRFLSIVELVSGSALQRMISN